jgi:hypothetical protein
MSKKFWKGLIISSILAFMFWYLFYVVCVKAEECVGCIPCEKWCAYQCPTKTHNEDCYSNCMDDCEENRECRHKFGLPYIPVGFVRVNVTCVEDDTPAEGIDVVIGHKYLNIFKKGKTNEFGNRWFMVTPGIFKIYVGDDEETMVVPGMFIPIFKDFKYECQPPTTTTTICIGCTTCPTTSIPKTTSTTSVLKTTTTSVYATTSIIYPTTSTIILESTSIPASSSSTTSIEDTTTIPIEPTTTIEETTTIPDTTTTVEELTTTTIEEPSTTTTHKPCSTTTSCRRR